MGVRDSMKRLSAGQNTFVLVGDVFQKQMIDQIINSAVYVKELKGTHEFPTEH